MENGTLIFIIVAALVIIFLICHCGGSQQSKYIGAPKWVMESYTFNENQPVSLTFEYDYTTSGYTEADTSFALTILNCPEDGGAPTCPTLNCGTIGTPNEACTPNNMLASGSAMWTTNFPGSDNKDGSDGNSTVYNVEVPFSNFYPIGTYTAYVLSYLTANQNVQSDPVQSTENIEITGPTGNPPTYTISSPTDGQYFAAGTSSITYTWSTTDTDYQFDYNIVLKIQDITTSPPTTFFTSGNLPSSTTTLTVSSPTWYSGQFSATVTSTSLDPGSGGDYGTSTGAASTCYIKLSVPTAVSASLS